MNWGNVYEIEFEPPMQVHGMVQTLPSASPVKIAAMNIAEAIQKATQQITAYPVSSVKLIVSNVQW